MALVPAMMLSFVACGDDYDDYDDYGYDDDYDDDYGYDDGDDYGYDDEYDDSYGDDYGYDDGDDYDNDDYSGSGNDDNYDDYDDNDAAGNSGNNSGSSSNSGSWSNLGSAKELNGTTVIVSIYADDTNTSWGSNNPEINDTLKYLGVACKWLEKQCANYGVTSKFVYDWSQDSDLYYTTTFPTDMTAESDEPYDLQMEYVDKNIDTNGLLSKYNADSIIYMLFFNTPDSSQVTSATFVYEQDSSYEYEIVSIFTHCDGYVEVPASYAHEIMHTFGAPDLYSADTDGTNYGIKQEYVTELENSNSNDIMYTTFDAITQDCYYDKITNELTEIDAYYIGITDHSDVVDKWGFDASQH